MPTSIDLIQATISVIEDVIIIKDYLGADYIPECTFNGIRFLDSGMGCQIKLNNPLIDFSFCD